MTCKTCGGARGQAEPCPECGYAEAPNARWPVPSLQSQIEQHRAEIASWPRWGRVAHSLVVGWRCPACILGRAMVRGELA